MIQALTGRRTLAWMSLLLVSGAPSMAAASAKIDCPMRTAPYSVDSPLIDVLLKPEAKAAVEAALPGFPAALMGTTPPTFSTIVTVRTLAGLTKMPLSALDGLNNALSRLPVTAADEQARCARYDVADPGIDIPNGKPRLLLFEKITGFRDAPSVEAAHSRLLDLARRNGWGIIATDKGGAVSSQILRKFDAVIWNNVSGDALTLTQRKALQRFIEKGGGFVGLHGSGGDPVSFWNWYSDTLIGARFAGHPMSPQFQEARVVVTTGANGIGAGLPNEWTLKDEWYSFDKSPRLTGARVIAALDESSYSPVGMLGKDLRMGDHPVVWTRCVKDGRAFYSAIGHLPETYAEPRHVMLLEQAIRWAAGAGPTKCRNGQEVPR
jgi:type 1 glutamine amidotransferase